MVGREDDFSTTAQGKMFLSHQTYEGFEISVHSHLKQSNSPFLYGLMQDVFTESFMQDVIEEYFVHQRTQRGRSDNPSAQQFGYNDLTIAAQRDVPKN